MKILLVAATRFEITPLLAKFGVAKLTPGETTTFHVNGHQVDVLVTGVGMVATAYHLGRQLDCASYGMAVNAGIAGSFNAGILPGTVVQVTEDVFADLGAESPGGFLTLTGMNLAHPDDPPFSGGKVKPLYMTDMAASLTGILQTIPGVAALTTNTIRTTPESLAWLRDIARADIETMEGAAFFYACRLSGVPCLQIRAVSNAAGEADHGKWETSLAIRRLSEFLERLFPEF
jgi:futalosine hydrolase